MKKRVLSLILAFIMLFSLLPASAFAEESDGESFVETEDVSAETENEALEEENPQINISDYTEEDWDDPEKLEEIEEILSEPLAGAETASGTCGESLTWTLDEEGILTISGTGAMNNYELNVNQAPWYSSRSSITSVKIVSGVSSIGNCAFEGCWGLTSVEIPSTVTSIGGDAFRSCSSLSNISLPTSVMSVGSAAFFGCTKCHISGSFGPNITWDVDLDGTLTISGTGEIPDVDPNNSPAPWYAADSLVKEIVVQDGITAIGGYAFRYFEETEEVDLPSSLLSIGNAAFMGCVKLCGVYVPNNVTSIGESAFAGCAELSFAHIPESVAYIGGNLFRGTKIYSAGPIGSGCDCEFGWRNKIPEESFSNCIELTAIEIPSPVSEIGNYAFRGCSNLKHVIIPGTVKTIGFSTFDGNTAITSAGPIGSGCDYEFGWTDEIPNYAFRGCSNLTSVKILSSINIIGSCAFWGCDSLKDVYYSGSEAQRGEISIIDVYNDALINATWHYNSSPDLLSISETSITMDVKGSNTKTLEYQYTFSDSDYYLQCSCDSQSSPSAVAVSKWDQNNKTIFLIAQAEGKATINLIVRNKNTQELVASASCDVTVTTRNKGSYFKFGIDTLNFNNGQNDLGNYYISDYDYKSLIAKNMSRISRRWIIDYIQSVYGKTNQGLCFGISSVMGLVYTGNLSPGILGANSIHDVEKPINNKSVASKLLYYAAIQKAFSFTNYGLVQPTGYVLCNQLLMNNGPAVLNVRPGIAGEGHAVLAYAIDDYTDDSNYLVYLADPNFLTSKAPFVLKISKNSYDIKGFYYMDNLYEENSDLDSFDSVIFDYSMYDDFTYIPEQYSYGSVTTGSKNFSVSNGTASLTVNGDSVSGDMELLGTKVFSNGVGGNECTYYFEPADHLSVTYYDKDNHHTIFADYDHDIFSSADSDADTLIFHSDGTVEYKNATGETSLELTVKDESIEGMYAFSMACKLGSAKVSANSDSYSIESDESIGDVAM